MERGTDDAVEAVDTDPPRGSQPPAAFSFCAVETPNVIGKVYWRPSVHTWVLNILCGRGTTNAHVPGCHEVALREISPRRLSATCVLASSPRAAGPVTIGLVAIVLLDWLQGHRTVEVEELVKRKGHVLLFRVERRRSRRLMTRIFTPSFSGTWPLSRTNLLLKESKPHAKRTAYMRAIAHWNATDRSRRKRINLDANLAQRRHSMDPCGAKTFERLSAIMSLSHVNRMRASVRHCMRKNTHVQMSGQRPCQNGAR